MAALLEELSLNAWPALRVMHYDGWVLRFSEGFTRRANSVNIVGPSSVDLETKIALCEQVYQDAGLRPVFKMWSGAECAQIDRLLVERGYAIEAPTEVRTRTLACSDSTADLDYRLEPEPSDAWLTAAVEFAAIHPDRRRVLEQIVGRIVPAHCFASLYVDGRPASVAIAVAERGWVGLFDVATAPEQRRRGYAGNLCLKLIDWGRQHGAAMSYLQVVENNFGATSLYEGLGFQHCYRYWYRANPPIPQQPP